MPLQFEPHLAVSQIVQKKISMAPPTKEEISKSLGRKAYIPKQSAYFTLTVKPFVLVAGHLGYMSIPDNVNFYFLETYRCLDRSISFWWVYYLRTSHMV
jgi:hypothetical protein